AVTKRITVSRSAGLVKSRARPPFRSWRSAALPRSCRVDPVRFPGVPFAAWPPDVTSTVSIPAAAAALARTRLSLSLIGLSRILPSVASMISTIFAHHPLQPRLEPPDDRLKIPFLHSAELVPGRHP